MRRRPNSASTGPETLGTISRKMMARSLSPRACAESTNGFTLTDCAVARTTRPRAGAYTTATVVMSTTFDVPSAPMTTSTTSSGGMVSITSKTREMTTSGRPPQ